MHDVLLFSHRVNTYFQNMHVFLFTKPMAHQLCHSGYNWYWCCWPICLMSSYSIGLIIRNTSVLNEEPLLLQKHTHFLHHQKTQRGRRIQRVPLVHRWHERVTHLFDILSVRRRDHLWGEALRRVQAFSQLLIDQVKRQGKLLSGQFPDVSNITQLPENKRTQVT